MPGDFPHAVIREDRKHVQKARIVCVSFGLVVAGSPAVGHHSCAPYDLERTVMLDGRIVDYEWRNPHV
jgi:hypothetical protein